MTNAKISKRAKAVLQNKALSSAIANALAGNSRQISRDVIIMKINGRIFRVKAAALVTRIMYVF